jgi:hypothetical protein
MPAECEELLKAVFPHLEGALGEEVSPEGGVLRIVARTAESVPVPCPDCATMTNYGRRPDTSEECRTP